VNRLWVRLTLAFVLVTLVGVSTVALLANLSASSQFRHYLARSEMMSQSDLAEDLAAYYERQGNWDSVEVVFDYAQGKGRMRRTSWQLVLADGQGLIVYDSQGQRPQGERIRPGNGIQFQRQSCGETHPGEPGRKREAGRQLKPQGHHAAQGERGAPKGHQPEIGKPRPEQPDGQHSEGGKG